MVLVVLGIELNSFNQVARLPQEKLLALKNLTSSGSLGNGATDTSLNPLLVTCIMLPKWCGQEELSCTI